MNANVITLHLYDWKTNAIMMHIFVLFLIFKICQYFYRRYQKKYFKSDSFTKLNRNTDHVEDQYEDIMELSNQIKKEFYSDFAPIIIEDELVKDSQKHTYLCSDSIINQLESNQIDAIAEYCGFTKSIGVKSRLEELSFKMLKLESKYSQFKTDCEEAFNEINKSVPFAIRLFSKKRVILFLGLKTATLEMNDIIPKYVFYNQKKSKRVVVEFNAQLVGDIFKLVSEHVDEEMSKIGFEVNKVEEG